MAEAKPRRQLVTKNQIQGYLHCRQCLKEIPHGTAPKEWARLAFGWTEKGFQVWCDRHDMNVGNFDLEGHLISYALEGKEDIQ